MKSIDTKRNGDFYLRVKMKEFAIIASKIKNQQKGEKMQDNLKSAQ